MPDDAAWSANISRCPDQHLPWQYTRVNIGAKRVHVHSSGAKAYRGDIDGLRAIAVLAVVAFHADAHRMPGGFIGVDVFFVISGYLITGLLLEALARGAFSLRTFYSRRIRRLFPALSLVLLSTVLAGWWLLPATAYAQLGKQLLAGSLFVANLEFWHEAGYFDIDARLKPLLHLWSLGVEEQFYIFWPLLLAWLWRRGYSLSAAVILVFLVSFACNLLQAGSNPVSAFYSPLTRFWELMSGAILATVESPNATGQTPAPARLVARAEGRKWLPDVLSIAGLAGVLCGLAVIDAGTTFPGWHALMPVGGTALLISAGPSAIVNRTLLCSRPMIWIGRISYPWYLWHWVLLFFLGQYTIPTRMTILGAVAVSLVFAWCTYVWVERPVRHSARGVEHVPLLTISLGILAATGLVIFAFSGVPSRFPVEVNRLTPPPTEAAYRYRQCFLDTKDQDERNFSPVCLDPAREGQTLVLLWGDSHAAHLYAGLHKLQERMPFRLVQYNASSCSPLIGPDQTSGATCARIDTFVRNEIARLRPDVVVLGNRWSRDGAAVDAGLKATMLFLRANGVRDVFVVGSPPRWDPNLYTVLFWFYRDHGRVPTRLQQPPTDWGNLLASDHELERLASSNGAHFVSAVEVLCNEAGCLTLVGPPPEGLVSPDYDHFTASGSEYFISKARSSGALKW